MTRAVIAGVVPVVALVGLGALVAVTTLPGGSDYLPFEPAFLMVTALLLGTPVDVLVAAGQRGGVDVSAVPLLALLVIASAILSSARRRERFRQPLAALTAAGAASLAAVTVVGVLTLIDGTFAARFDTGSVYVRLGALAVAGPAAQWLLVWLGARWRPVRWVLGGLLLLGAALTGALTAALAPFASTSSQVALAGAGVALASVNLLVLAATWALGQPLVADGVAIGLVDSARDAPLLWLAPVFVMALWVVWVQLWPSPASFGAFFRRTVVTFACVFLALVAAPALAGIDATLIGEADIVVRAIRLPWGLAPDVGGASNVLRALVASAALTMVAATVWAGRARLTRQAWTHVPVTAADVRRAAAPMFRWIGATVAAAGRRSASAGGTTRDDAESPPPPRFCAGCGAGVTGRFCGRCGRATSTLPAIANGGTHVR